LRLGSQPYEEEIKDFPTQANLSGHRFFAGSVRTRTDRIRPAEEVISSIKGDYVSVLPVHISVLGDLSPVEI
jgi:hypothetical protein